MERLPGKHGQNRRFASLVVMVDDTAGQLGRLFGDLGALAVNVEDFRLEHSPGAPFGLAEIAVAPSVLRDATAGLDARIDELLDRLELKARRGHKPDALSGGEQQRVAIARALVADPAILLADEPTGSLDSVSGQNICRLLRDLCSEQRRTIVMVTHEPAVAMWADRVVVLKDGRDLPGFAIGNAREPQAVSSGYQQALQTAAG